MGVVICNGMNRSGSTLQYNLVRSLVEYSNYGKGEGYYTEEELIEYKQDLIDWSRSPQIRVLKTHSIPETLTSCSELKSLKICYIYRDVRDVAASYKLIWNFSIEKIIEEIDRAIAEYYKLKLVSYPVLWQKYESVISDIPKALEDVSELLGIESNYDVQNKVIKDCSIEEADRVSNSLKLSISVHKNYSKLKKIFRFTKPVNFRKPESKNYGGRMALKKKEIDQKSLLHVNHISKFKGMEGTWKIVLSPKEAAVFSKRYYSWLYETGYLGEE